MTVKDDALGYFKSDGEQLDLAHRLDEVFDVTYAHPLGQLSYWLAEPKAHAVERFGLNKEILVIYSPHKRTDARVLTAIEQISRFPDFKHRIDKVLVLLIHKGRQQETRQLVTEQNDWVVVPIHSSELEDPQRGNMFLRNRISEFMGTVDLFGMSSPIKHDKYFYGREEMVHTLIQRATQKKEGSGPFGLRKTGKTSVLFAVERRLAERPILVVYFDCHNPGLYGGRWWQILENVCERCAAKLESEKKRTVRVGLQYSEKSAGTRFSTDINAILQGGELNQIILMLDEVEFITPGLSNLLGQHWDKDFLPFWQTIRAAHQELQGRLTFIVAGVNPASVERTHFDTVPNPLFQLAFPQYVEPLSTSAVRDMVRSIGRYLGLRIDEAVYQYLHDTYGGHPYLIRLACSETCTRLGPAPIDARVVVEVDHLVRYRGEIRARLAQPIKDILLSLVWWYPEDYDLLQILATGDKAFFLEFLKQQPQAAVQFGKRGGPRNSDRGISDSLASSNDCESGQYEEQEHEKDQKESRRRVQGQGGVGGG